MSRTILCVLTAVGLAVLSLGVMITRRAVLGDEAEGLRGPGAWKVTLEVHGTSKGSARLVTATPLELECQHVVEEHWESSHFSCRPSRTRQPEDRSLLWSQREPSGSFVVRSAFQLLVGARRPYLWAPTPVPGVYEAPRDNDYLHTQPGIEVNDPRITTQAHKLVDPLGPSANQLDIAQALYTYVGHQIRLAPAQAQMSTDRPGKNRDASYMSAGDCLRAQSGDAGGKSRLLVALLRNRGIPARVVSGVSLTRGAVQQPHHWVEAWIHGGWVPICAHHGHFGRVPPTYLVMGFHDEPLVRGRGVEGLRWAFRVQSLRGPNPTTLDSPVHRTFARLSLHALPPTERHLVELLLLLPVATLIICVCRNLIGLGSFGIFAPALIGLAFHDLHSLPGIGVFVAILFIGWGLRRVLDHYHLLQVPRVALLLTLITVVLIVSVVGSNLYGTPATHYISLFPVVILTGLVERFWTSETEDSVSASFQTLFQTMLIATVIALVLGLPLVGRYLFCYPELLGVIMAVQLLIGRYTGYRLLELLRFRALLQHPSPVGVGESPVGFGYRTSELA